MAWHDIFTQFLSNKKEHTAASFINSVFQEALDNDKYLKQNKLDTTNVVNTVTETVTGKALDAVQNNPNMPDTLAYKINDLNGKFVTWQCDILNLRNGFASIGNTPAYFNRVGSLVAINNMILQTSSAIVVSGTVILEGIPIELRPSTLRGIILKGLDGKSYNAVVTPTGTVYCDNSITAWATGISIDISCSYNL